MVRRCGGPTPWHERGPAVFHRGPPGPSFYMGNAAALREPIRGRHGPPPHSPCGASRPARGSDARAAKPLGSPGRRDPPFPPPSTASPLRCRPPAPRPHPRRPELARPLPLRLALGPTQAFRSGGQARPPRCRGLNEFEVPPLVFADSSRSAGFSTLAWAGRARGRGFFRAQSRTTDLRCDPGRVVGGRG